MARILILTPQLPYPPEQGTSLRNYHILRGLSSSHEVSLLSFDENQDSSPFPTELNFCQEINTIPVPRRSTTDRFRGLVTSRQPDMARRLRSAQLERCLSELLAPGDRDNPKPFDIVQIEGLELAYSLAIARKARPSIKIVFDNHNAENELQRRAYLADRRNPRRWHASLYSLIQSRRLRAYESSIFRQADWVTFVSEEDSRNAKGLVPGLSTTVIPNCIDVNDYDLSQGDDDIRNDLLFVGKMDYRPNVDAVLWFAKEIWPQLREFNPDITWAIVGKNPHLRLNYLRETEGIQLTGRVKRIQPYLKGAKVVILPFRVGSGTRLKFIEAMASSKAIVSTNVGIEGFNVQDGRELLIANKPDDFVRAVLVLLDDPNQRARLGVAGREKAKEYDWRKVIPLFNQVYKSLLAPSRV